MDKRSHTPRLFPVNDTILWLAAMILIPLVAIVYGVLFASTVMIPRAWRGKTNRFEFS